MILINTARGALVDEAALIEALAQRSDRATPGSTSFMPSRSQRDHPLARMENVTLSSHAAFRTLEASMTLMRRAIDIVRRVVGCHDSRASGMLNADVARSGLDEIE